MREKSIHRKGEKWKMSNIESIVPPLELCKLIPAGEFEDSVFIWGYSCDKRNTKPFVDERDCVEYCRRNMVNAPSVFPAPTLQEIMAEIPFSQVSILASGSFVIHPRFGKNAILRYYDDNAATAALKLWLKMKGIKYEQEQG